MPSSLFVLVAAFLLVGFTSRIVGRKPLFLTGIQPMTTTCLKTFVVKNQWRNIIIFTDKDPGKLVQLMTSACVMSAAVKVQENSSFSFILGSSTYFSRGRHGIIVLCNILCLSKFANKARELNMFGKRFKWLFIINNRDELTELSKLFELIHMEDTISVISYVYFLTVPVDQKSIDSLTECELNRMVNKRINNTHKLELVALRDLWDGQPTDNGFKLSLTGYDLKIATINAPPIIIVQRRDGLQPIFSGYIADLIDTVSEYLGFSYKYYLDPKNKYGILQNGNWTGVIGMVYRQEVDVGALTITLNYQRLLAVEFSAFMTLNFNVGVMKKPTHSDQWSFSVYGAPFSLVLWLMCGLICLLLFLSMTFAVVVFTITQKSHTSGDVIVWTAISAILSKGTTELPRRRTSQSLLLMLVVFVLIVSKCYVSLLTSSLTIKKPPAMYNDLDEVVDAGLNRIASLAQTATTSNLEKAKSGTFRRVWKYMQKDPDCLVNSDDEGFSKVLTKGYIYYTSLLLNAGPRVFNSKCSMEVLKERYNRHTQHLIFPKFSPLEEVISSKLLSMRSAGVMEKLQNKHFPANGPNTCKPKPSMTVPMQQAVGAFTFLIVGIFIAIVFLFIELWFDKCNKYRRFSRKLIK